MGNGNKLSIYLQDATMLKLSKMASETDESASSVIAKTINVAFLRYLAKLQLSEGAVVALKNQRFDCLNATINSNGVTTIGLTPNGYAELSEKCGELMRMLHESSIPEGNIKYRVFCYDSAQSVERTDFLDLNKAKAFAAEITEQKRNEIGNPNILRENVSEDNINKNWVYELVTVDNRVIIIHIEPIEAK